MAKKKADDAKKKGGAKKFAPILFLVIGVVVGPKFMGGGKGAEAGAETTTTTEPGPIVTLDSITLNLSDGHLLKVGMALQISAEWVEEHGWAEEGETDPKLQFPQALDAAISIFGSRDMPSLMGNDSRDAARAELVAQLEETFHGEVEDVYFTEFVMQ